MQRGAAVVCCCSRVVRDPLKLLLQVGPRLRDSSLLAALGELGEQAIVDNLKQPGADGICAVCCAAVLELLFCSALLFCGACVHEQQCPPVQLFSFDNPSLRVALGTTRYRLFI